MRNKRTFPILMLAIFSFTAIYLCPCVQASDQLRFSKSHDCCDQMPNCPMNKCSEYGLMSMLPLFALKISDVEIKAPILQHQTTIESGEQTFHGLFPEQGLKIAASPPQIPFLSTPKLFIKNLVLLI